MRLSFFKIIVFLLISLSLVKSVFAQTTELKNETEVASTEAKEHKDADDKTKSADQNTTSSKETKPVSKAKPTKKVFKPTEEISEDSPVPFPVDI